ncbi:hypothetical protein [Paenibacillus wynnii]|uniref:hypothetical protein n=1 Tax=Paenibacillus wynnii TaxID=268407 RepID=UPI0012F90144|nr:hypothetical protein [Paenibacillus wynnii]
MKQTNFIEFHDLIKGNKPMEPVTFEYVQGSINKDIILGGGAVYLLSSQLIQALMEHNFTGWDTFKVEATGKDRVPIEGYEGLFITRTAGPFDYSFCQDKLMPNPRGIMIPAYIGMGFDPQTWDGSDIFSLQNTTHVIVSRQVQEVLRKFKTNSVNLIPLNDYINFK